MQIAQLGCAGKKLTHLLIATATYVIVMCFLAVSVRSYSAQCSYIVPWLLFYLWQPYQI